MNATQPSKLDSNNHNKSHLFLRPIKQFQCYFNKEKEEKSLNIFYETTIVW